MSETNEKFPVNFPDIEALAWQTLVDKGHPERSDGWTHRKGGVETGATLHRAKEIYETIGLKMKAINDLDYDALDIDSVFAGQPISLPISVAPMVSGINFVCDKPFEQIARAAARLNVAAGIGYLSGLTVYGGMAALGAKAFQIIKPASQQEKLLKELQESFAGGCCAAGIDIDSIGGMKPVGDELRFAELAWPYGKEELRRAMILMGVPSLKALSPRNLCPLDEKGERLLAKCGGR
jgi:hypothetical protein